MPYTAEISRKNPTCLLFLLDQSYSMNDELAPGVTRAGFVADALNKVLMEASVKCRRAEGVLDYFDVGVLAYGNEEVWPGFSGALAGAHVSPISAVARNPLRVETRRKKVPDGAGGLAEVDVKFPVWFEPHANGGTPMCKAFGQARDLLRAWCSDHPNAFPPTVMHVTDGEATDGDAIAVERAAAEITGLSTKDGNVVLMTLHVSGEGGSPVRYAHAATGLPAGYGELMFRVTSPLPQRHREQALASGVSVREGSRGYVLNGGAEDVVTFFDIGTRPALPAPAR